MQELGSQTMIINLGFDVTNTLGLESNCERFKPASVNSQTLFCGYKIYSIPLHHVNKFQSDAEQW